MKAEDDCKVERKHTLKLRHAMEQRPSQELLWELQQEKALLQARVQELEASTQVAAGGAAGGAAWARASRSQALPCQPPPAPPAGGEAGQEQPLHPGAGGGLAAGSAGPPGAGQHHLRPAQRPAPGGGPARPGTPRGRGHGAGAKPGRRPLGSAPRPYLALAGGAGPEQLPRSLPAPRPHPRTGRPNLWSGSPAPAGAAGGRVSCRLSSPAVHGGEGDVRATVPGAAEGLQDVQGPHRGRPAADGGGRHRAGPGRHLPPATSTDPGGRRATAQARLLRCEPISTSHHPRGLQPALGRGRSAKWALNDKSRTCARNARQRGEHGLPLRPARCREPHVPFCWTSQTFSIYTQFCFCFIKMEAICFILQVIF